MEMMETIDDKCIIKECIFTYIIIPCITDKCHWILKTVSKDGAT